MSDTITPQPEASAAGVRLQFVDAREVMIDQNVRTNTKITKPFVNSIKRHGVIVPVLAHPAEDGRVYVEDGQRRILAAIDAERYEVPAFVIPEGDTETARIVRQLIANEHRAELDEVERVAAWKQLELDGMNVVAIARSVGETPKRVKAGIAVADNKTAAKEVAKYEVTFDQALAIAEFEDDPKAAERLRQTARSNPAQFEHTAQRLRDQRTDRQVVEELIATYTERGYQRIDWPRYDDKDTLPFSALTHADGTDLGVGYVGGNGYRYAVRDAWNGFEVGHFVTEWKKSGLKKRKANGTPNLPWTDEQKAERRTLIANNKAWESAEKVRREWLVTFLSRKRAPKDALTFIADAVIENRGSLSGALSERHRFAAELLGLSKPEWGEQNPLAAHIASHPARTATVLLAVAIAACEAATSKQTWRYPTGDAVAYFTALREWGYALSDVENIVLGIAPDADEQAEPTPQDDAADDAESAGEGGEGAPEPAEPEDANTDAEDAGGTEDEDEDDAESGIEASAPDAEECEVTVA
ncbi:ParB/RepB/Spo0J family partition protein [Microbacterium sp. NPDC056234]|uniref:ParB/RepB/Spo0J family partition protein n=1 Tax=Microbacterium sp. NPDC056234 TaxID=3345757 RepID=UPI0035DC86C2